MTGINQLQKITDLIWEIPKSFRPDMRVPARVLASKKMLAGISRDRSLEQLVNVAALPGIQQYALCMPDVHEGYGFPVGGVAAFDVEEGIISPGGIGYDINCGVRLLKSGLTYKDIKSRLPQLGAAIYREVPSGVGKGGQLKLSPAELDKFLKLGPRRAVELGYGQADDLKNIESEGALTEADPALVSDRAKARSRDQLGTMGAGNHFVEVQRVEKIFNETAAQKLNLFENQVTVLIHTGSRGLGHQIATDYIALMMRVMAKYNITLPDRELAGAPFKSPEGQNYFKAMGAGANFAWANRQLITHEVRSAWQKVLGESGGQLALVYDVAHNIAKIETYEIDGRKRPVVVHRKGATRAFPDQPVLIPGSMGTGSYVLMGQPESLKQSFGSTCHGAGRRMSRARAKREVWGSDLKKQLEQEGIVINAGSLAGLAEEAPTAYKDVDEVVSVVHDIGIATKVARLKPIAVIKG